MIDAVTKISVEKRILLHLQKYTKAYEEAWEVPHAISQEGIAEALDILLNNVSRAMKGLRREGKVVERLAHIKGVKRRRRAYFLTEDGMRATRVLMQELQQESVGYRDKDGRVGSMSLEKAAGRLRLDLGRSVSVSEVLEAVRSDGIIDPVNFRSTMKTEGSDMEREKTPRFVDITDSAPRLLEFVGRDVEISRIAQCLDGRGPPIIVIHGMAGIGKTSVALKVLEDLRGKRHLFYYRFHSWDSLHNITNSLLELLKGMRYGPKTLKDLLDSDVNVLASFLARELGPKKVLLVFDDLHRMKDDILPLFRLLNDLTSGYKGLRIMVLSRTVPKFYTRRDVSVNRVVEEIHLDSLDLDATRALLGKDYPDGALERIYDLSRGVPLFLEILGSVDNVDAIEDIRRYVEEEIFSQLGVGERKVLENLSVYRYPVPSEAILSQGTNFDDLSGLCRRSLVIELPHRRFEAHDLIKEFTYVRCSPSSRTECHGRAAHFYQSTAEDANPMNELYFSSQLAQLEAAHHLQKSGDAQGAATLLLGIGPDMLAHGYTEVIDILDTFKRSDVDDRTWAEVILQRGDAAASSKDWTRALSLYKEALRAKMDLGAERTTLAAIHGMIGRMQMQVERWEETIRSHKDALRMFEEDGDDRGMAKELINLGIVYRNRNDWERAQVSYEKANDLLRALGDKAGLIVLHNNWALLKRAQGDIRSAKKHIAKVLDLTKGSEDEEGRAMILFTRGDMRMNLGDLEGGGRDLREAADIFRRAKHFGPAIQIHLSLGDSLLEKGQVDAAMRSFLKALDIYQFKKGGGLSIFRRRRMAEDHAILASIYDRLAAVSMSKGDLKEALGFHIKAMDNFEACSDRSAWARKHLDIGLVNEELGRLGEARANMELALDVLAPTDDVVGSAAVHFNLIRIFEAMDNGPRAAEHARRLKDLAKILGDKELGYIAKKALKRHGSEDAKGKGKR